MGNNLFYHYVPELNLNFIRGKWLLHNKFHTVDDLIKFWYLVGKTV